MSLNRRRLLWFVHAVGWLLIAGPGTSEDNFELMTAGSIGGLSLVIGTLWLLERAERNAGQIPPRIDFIS